MSLIIPGDEEVVEIINDLPNLNEAKLRNALKEPRLFTGLDDWQFWTFVCLARHVARQKWVAGVVESLLKGDPGNIGKMGALGHPDEQETSGQVPDMPGWNYFFHGTGCNLTNEATGMDIDVDFTRDDQRVRIDPYFYSRFLCSLSKPEFPESILKKADPLRDYWHADLPQLEQLECWVDREITGFAELLFEVLRPVLDLVGALHDQDSPDAKTKLVYLCLHLGCVVHASAVAHPEFLPASLVDEIGKKAHDRMKARAERLSRLLAKPKPGDHIQLEALAELGPDLAKAEVVKRLFLTPVDGAANTALAVLILWDPIDLDSILEKLLEQRTREMEASRVLDAADATVSDSQYVKLARILVFRHRKNLDPGTKQTLLETLPKIKSARQGLAACLVYVLDKGAGLELLDRSLNASIPMTCSEAAAACCLIDSEETKELLIKALEAPEPDNQHVAAWALHRIAGKDTCPELSNWLRRNDGLVDPLGAVSLHGTSAVPMDTRDDFRHEHGRIYLEGAVESLEFSGLSALLKDA